MRIRGNLVRAHLGNPDLLPQLGREGLEERPPPQDVLPWTVPIEEAVDLRQRPERPLRVLQFDGELDDRTLGGLTLSIVEPLEEAKSFKLSGFFEIEPRHAGTAAARKAGGVRNLEEVTEVTASVR